MRKIFSAILGLVLLSILCFGVSTPTPPFPPTAVSFAASGNNTVVSASTNFVYMYGLLVTVSGATNLTVQDSCSSPVLGPYNLTGNGSTLAFYLRENGFSPYYITGKGCALVINSSQAVTVTGTVWSYTN